jgi:hypothetical protein
VADDALHLMTPDIGHGGCAALEDGVTTKNWHEAGVSNSGVYGKHLGKQHMPTCCADVGNGPAMAVRLDETLSLV